MEEVDTHTHTLDTFAHYNEWSSHSTMELTLCTEAPIPKRDFRFRLAIFTVFPDPKVDHMVSINDFYKF